LGKFRLWPHPDTPGRGIRLGCKVSTAGSGLLAFEYVITGEIGTLLLPGPADCARADGLWRHTCFEAFIEDREGGYLELNFSPSGAWAGYMFDGYREGMGHAENLSLESSERMNNGNRLSVRAVVRTDVLAGCGPLRLGLCAVIEQTDGTTSYWALAHPPGKPDFHHPDCFAASLAPPGEA